MKKFKAKWNNEDVYVHFIPRNKTYVIVSKEESEDKLFKLDIVKVDISEKELEAYFLGQVERGLH